MRRLFLAVDLPEELVLRLGEFTRRMRSRLPMARWVKSDQMHLTVKFLGDTPEDTLPGILDATAGVCRLVPPSELTVEGFSAFPSIHKPRVLYSGLSGDLSAVQRLVQGLESSLEPLGFPLEGRPYSPHITLGRIRPGSGGRPDIVVFDRFGTERFGGFPVDGVILYESQLTSQGAIHTPLERFPFPRLR